MSDLQILLSVLGVLALLSIPVVTILWAWWWVFEDEDPPGADGVKQRRTTQHNTKETLK